jgi:erythromycin esterase-like protein
MVNIDYNILNNLKDVDLLIDMIGESQFVLLGESSHGTSEFYQWRSEISKRLIKEKGFSFIAVEGDWPDCFKVNKYIKGYPDSGKTAYDVLHSFNRWPTWMWANKEMVELVEWLKQNNLYNNEQNKVGFYGLDLYSLWESMDEIIKYLKKVDPSALKNAIEAYDCFEPYNREEEKYAHAAAFVPKNCEEELIEMLISIRNKNDYYNKNNKNKEDYFAAEQNAITAKDAERYYRTMIKGDVQSWNLRDTHMMDTLDRLMNFHSSYNNNTNIKPKSIIWAHNTHIGDARFTDMKESGMINLGQLVREKMENKNSVLVGFSTYSGSVIAARRWGEKMEKMEVPPAREGSWDNLLHFIGNDNIDNNGKNKLVIFSNEIDKIQNLKNQKGEYRDNNNNDNKNDDRFENKGQRAIGVVYNPKYEKYGNYVPTILSLRYDALIFIDKTTALSPLHMQSVNDKDLPETFPTGM